MIQVSLRMDEKLLESVDGARGEIPRERWIRMAILAMLLDDQRPMVEGERSPRVWEKSVGLREPSREPVINTPAEKAAKLDKARELVAKDSRLEWGGVGGRPPVQKKGH